ncbi:MAG: hypothetical protein L0229_18530 [Blastocatellia bacterium]|nr:hypothetical protein [Blastocatellia bacterium]
MSSKPFGGLRPDGPPGRDEPGRSGHGRGGPVAGRSVGRAPRRVLPVKR